MRRLTTTDREDRGGATVFIIVAITAVMIGVGFAIDVGQYVAAARSAQNTADATALAVALLALWTAFGTTLSAKLTAIVNAI
jgi:Flp pilus assembly protein TadG